MQCNNFEVHCFYFSHRRKPNVPSSSQVRKTNVNKQRLLFITQQIIFSLFLSTGAANSSLLYWTNSFMIFLTSLGSA